MMTSGRYSHLTITNPQVWYSETPSGQLCCKTKCCSDHYRSTLYTTGASRILMVRDYPHGSLISGEKAIELKRLMTFVLIPTLVLADRSITNTTYHSYHQIHWPSKGLLLTTFICWANPFFRIDVVTRSRIRGAERENCAGQRLERSGVRSHRNIRSHTHSRSQCLAAMPGPTSYCQIFRQVVRLAKKRSHARRFPSRPRDGDARVCFRSCTSLPHEAFANPSRPSGSGPESHTSGRRGRCTVWLSCHKHS
jgi:hypothetical protein